MARRRHSEERRAYVVTTLEELKRQVQEVANDPHGYLPEEEIRDFIAFQLFNVHWRTGDIVSTLSATIELIEDVCEDLAEIRAWAKKKGFKPE